MPMRPQLENILPDPKSSFKVLHIHQAEFDAVWHSHPETELTLIHKGSGRRLVGGHLEDFGDGDLVLIGPGIPHFWRSDPGLEPWRAKATTIQFDPRRLGFGDPEPRDLDPIRELLRSAQFGVAFPPSPALADSMSRFRRASGWRRLALLIEVLGTLAEHAPAARRILAPPDPALHSRPRPPAAAAVDASLNRALQFIFGHLGEKVTLDDAARAAGMPRFAFCRFFRAAMGTGFSDFLNDTRIAYACQHLRSRHSDIASIAFQSGFGTLSNFNRVFRERCGTTPSQFRADVRNRNISAASVS
ncbi:AraC family transcriptional regulator [soil metagenome]